MQTIQNFLSSTSGTVFTIAIIILAALLIQGFLKVALGRSASLFTRRDLFKTSRDREKRIKTFNSIISAITGLAVWSVAVLMILDTLGIPIGPIIASLGILGAAIAFGTQSLIKDFVSGLFIIAENQYKVDDYVEIGALVGQVEAISVRTTTIRGEDGSINFIPNGSVAAVSNKSVGQLKEFIKLELAGDTDLTKFAKTITAIAENLQVADHHSSIISDGPSIASIQSISKKTVVVVLEIKTSASKRKDAVSAVWRALAEAEHKGDITFG